MTAKQVQFDFAVPVEDGILGYARNTMDKGYGHAPGTWWWANHRDKEKIGEMVGGATALFLINQSFPPIPEGPLPNSYSVSGSIEY